MTPPPKVTFGGEFDARLTALACSTAPDGRARWTVRLLAEKVSEEASERLASVMLEPKLAADPGVEKCAEAWPQLFNDARSKVDDIEASLRRISTFLHATEL